MADCPELAGVVGRTVITTDGTTLLGGDDKAGIAVIMDAVRTLVEDPSIPHGPVVVVFTCDEEIGKGVLHLDPAMLGGAVVAYTLDGGGVGEIEDETFSADAATVTITGVNIHPSIGKDRMTNAVRLAAMFLDRLPQRTDQPGDDGRPGRVRPPVYHRRRGRRGDHPTSCSGTSTRPNWPSTRSCSGRSAGRSSGSTRPPG